MKRVIVLIVVLLASGWFIKARFNTSTPATLAPLSTLPEKPRPSAEVLRPAAPATTAASANVVPSAPVIPPPQPVNPASASSQQMSLVEVVEPNNIFHDAVLGVSATFPEGWSVRQAIRWGQNNRENTVFFKPPEGSEAVPSMYYQTYPNGAPDVGDAEAMLREMAKQKEASRLQAGLTDYTNDPGSFVFLEIDGHPSLSYFATFTKGDQVQAEYFTRILGDKGYVMLFVHGPAKDVQTLIPSVHQMRNTVKPP